MRRHPGNPILTRDDVPPVSPLVSDPSSVFNPGAIKLGERYLLLLRVQTRGRETVLMFAESEDGVSFRVIPQLVEIQGLEEIEPRPFHVYDPRLTLIGDEVLMVASADTETGCHLLVARMDSDLRLTLVSFDAGQEARNGVLFPEKIDGRYCRLERPNRTRLASGTLTGDEIRLASSDDLVHWTPGSTVMAGRFHYWDELIGSGPPPVKTREGWLHVYHGVATHFGGGVYQAGVCLLDLADPSRLLSRGRNNILEPRELYETVGQVPNVVFPTGLIVEEFDDAGFAAPRSRVLMYHGAADTCVCLVETSIHELIEASRLQ